MYRHYRIAGYPQDVPLILSKDGLGRIVGKETSLASIDKKDANNQYACTYGVDSICIEIDNNNKEQYCEKGESQANCEARLCPNEGEKNNCIKEKGVYYICNSRRYDSTEGVCHRYGTSEADRQKAIEYAEKNGGKNVNCCPNCVIKIIPSCPACIITNGGTTLDYRTVSKVSLNPNGKTMGYNWNTDNTKYPELTIKAKYTIDEIESSEEKKFNESTTDPEALTNSYLLRVEMTQSMADDIKKYNKAINKEGSYINSTMVCKDFVLEGKKKEDCTGDYKWDGKNCVIERILCYSTFIDELIEGDESGLIEGYAKQIKFGIDPDKSAVQVRKDLKNNNYTFKKYEYKVPGEPASSTVTVMSNGYWTIFPSFSKNYVGPSWK